MEYILSNYVPSESDYRIDTVVRFSDHIYLIRMLLLLLLYIYNVNQYFFLMGLLPC